jgi:hypothetical protein
LRSPLSPIRITCLTFIPMRKTQGLLAAEVGYYHAVNDAG